MNDECCFKKTNKNVIFFGCSPTVGILPTVIERGLFEAENSTTP
jgi:hypothetical protein